jgi:hypothetical protein
LTGSSEDDERVSHKTLGHKASDADAEAFNQKSRVNFIF